MSTEDPSVKLYRARRRLARLRAWRWPNRVAFVGCIIPSFCLVTFMLVGVVLFDRTASGFQAFGLSLLYFGLPGYILYRRRQKTLKNTATAEAKFTELNQLIRGSNTRADTAQGLSIAAGDAPEGALSQPTTDETHRTP